MRLGIDLGGTKTEIAVVSGDGSVVWTKRIDTSAESYSQILSQLKALVGEAYEVTGYDGSIGVSIPGSVSPVSGLIRGANTQVLNGRDFVNDLRAKVGRQVNVANDANCFTLSEATDGAACDYANVFGVILGTGCGGGLVIDNKLIQGRNMVSGEWGHSPLPWIEERDLPRRHCWCGLFDCLETYISGSAVSREYEMLTGTNLPVQQIVEISSTNDNAEQVLLNLENRLARAFAIIINFIDPDAIVIGGGLSNLSRLYSSIPLQWGNYVFSDSVKTELLPPKYGDSSGIRGAAWLQ